MAKKQYFIPKQQAPYVNWHDNLKNGVSATTPGATAADVTMLAADNAALHTKLTAATLADNASTAAHKELNSAIATSKTNAQQLSQRIKNSTSYTDTIGTQLNLIGPEDCTDMTQAQPTLYTNAKSSGVVEIAFNKLDAEGVHIYGQRDGETGFNFLASETHSPYIDNRPLLVAGKPETRQYKAVFFIGKAETGLPSAIVTAIAAP
jgi:hypothetical protein